MQVPSHSLIDGETTVMWFRRDLRLADNAALYHALRASKMVQPVFIFDTCLLSNLEDDDARVHFIHQSLVFLQRELVQLGATLLVFHGDPVRIFGQIAPGAVYVNSDYEPYATARDARIKEILDANGVAFHSFKDHVIFEKHEVIKENGHPYTMFTPYSAKWKANLVPSSWRSYPVEKYLGNLKRSKPAPVPSLRDIGFKASSLEFPPRSVPLNIIRNYNRTRNFPGVKGTTRLSVHLRFGTISIRKLVRIANKTNAAWLNELIWRDFYHMILWHFPRVDKAFKPAYDNIQWRNDEVEFKKWCEGKTGYPLVDAGMRELNETGFMHNRVRMVVASFLTRHLVIDWRWGEAYFASKLLDFDLAANNGGWQWAAGSGCDAAPYFRVFNPSLQIKKFDPAMTYTKRWIPELDTAAYPPPLIDHSFARQRALTVYKKGLNRT